VHDEAGFAHIDVFVVCDGEILHKNEFVQFAVASPVEYAGDRGEISSGIDLAGDGRDRSMLFVEPHGHVGDVFVADVVHLIKEQLQDCYRMLCRKDDFDDVTKFVVGGNPGAFEADSRQFFDHPHFGKALVVEAL
jgi:hypothetical protein